MKRYLYKILAGCILMSVVTLISGQEKAVTNSGKEVVLHSNKTWEYSSVAANDTMQKAANQNGKSEDQGKPQSAASGNNAATNTEIAPVAQEETGFSQNELITLAIAALIIIGLLLYFLVIQPARKSKDYVKAFSIIDAADEENYPEAIQLLEKSILKGLKSNVANDVFFALAYTKLKLEKFEEAYADVQKITTADADSLYLKLYILYKKKLYKEVYDLYLTNSSALDSKDQTKEIVSIACIESGKEKCQKQMHEQALPYFDMVKKLKIYADLIPDSISNLQVTLGIQALYNKDYEKAVDCFTKARNKALEEKRTTIECDLGMVLCEWAQSEMPDMEDKITEIIDLIKKDYKEIAPFKDEELKNEKLTVTEKHLVVSNIHLLYSISYIYSWFQLPPKRGLPDDRMKIIKERLRNVQIFNPLQNDSKLIMGLIEYYFNEESGKEKAIELLEDSQAKIPDLIQMVRKEKENIEKDKKVLERYIELAYTYLKNDKIPAEFRTELNERLTRYERFHKASGQFGKDKMSTEVESATLKDIQERTLLTRKHINDILKNKFKDMNKVDNEQFSTLINNMNEASEIINNSTKNLEKTEKILMLNTGEYLLNEEETAENTSKTSKKK